LADSHSNSPATGDTPSTRARPLGQGPLANAIIVVVIFVLGVAVGFPVATLGAGLFAENATAVLSGLLAVLMVVIIAGGSIILFRDRIWKALFNRSKVEAVRLAKPLGDIARYAAENNVQEATLAARDFGELAVARYSWIATRRWIVSATSTLVVAIAAIAGAALLFQQNVLLRDQSVLLAEQNNRIDDQTALMQAQIQLGEAQRSTSIVPEILAIGAAIGAETAALSIDGRATPAFSASELSESLRARIVAASNSARPYRHVPSPLTGLSDLEIVSLAMRRRTDLPSIAADYERWQAIQPPRSLAELGMPSDQLTDREVSPERGQLISLLYNSGIVDTELLSSAGADFSFAELRQPLLVGMSFRYAALRFIDFSTVEIRNVDFAGAALDQARFRSAYIVDSHFDGIVGGADRPPANVDLLPGTGMIGADFSGAFIDRSTFVSVRAFAANFDGAFIGNSDFSGAALGAATFRGAILFNNIFDHADLASVDLSGVIVFDPNFLVMLEATAESFVADRYAIEPLPLDREDNVHAFRFDDAMLEALDNGVLEGFIVVEVGEFDTEYVANEIPD